MPQTMRALVKTSRAPGLTLTQVPIPSINKTEVLVKVRATSICGTDLHIYYWDDWAKARITNIPLIQGHELCGDIVKVGADVKAISIGDFISAESHIVDFNGEYFKKGLGHVAPETKIIGVDTNGSFAEYIALPWQNVRKNPPNLPIKIAVLKENFGNAVHTAFATDVKDKCVLVTGCGPAGLMLIAILKSQGVKTLIASDISEYRRTFAKKMGADIVIDPDKEKIIDTIKKTVHQIEVFFEMSGSESAINEGLASTRPGGHIVCFGLFKSPVKLDINKLLIFKGITLHGIVGRKLWDTWEHTEDLIDNKQLDLSPIVTHTFKLEEYEKAFATFSSRKSGKVMITI